MARSKKNMTPRDRKSPPVAARQPRGITMVSALGRRAHLPPEQKATPTSRSPLLATIVLALKAATRLGAHRGSNASNGGFLSRRTLGICKPH